MTIIALTLLTTLGCTKPAPKGPVEPELPERSKLKLYIGRGVTKHGQFLNPQYVGLTGRLSEGLDLEEFYCAIISWDYDNDGHPESEHFPTMNCNGVQRVFYKQIPFRFYGSYTVRLTLKHHLTQKVLLTDTAQVTIQGERDSDE